MLVVSKKVWQKLKIKITNLRIRALGNYCYLPELTTSLYLLNVSQRQFELLIEFHLLFDALRYEVSQDEEEHNDK